MALALNFPQIDMKLLNVPLRNKENNSFLRTIKSKKCLFGPTNPEETHQMVKENFDQERERFFTRFGIHMEDLDRLAIDSDQYQKSKCPQQPSSTHIGNNGGGKITRKSFRMKRALKPYNANVTNNQQSQLQQQMKITDFCQVKKSPTTNTSMIQEKEKMMQQDEL